MYMRFIHGLGHLLFGRRSLILMGFMILMLAAHVIYHLFLWVLSATNDLNVIYEEEEDISSLFLAIGLILKERRLLQKIFYHDPSPETASDLQINDVCLTIGINLILTGTILRLSVQLTKLPNYIIPYQTMEYVLFGLGLLFCVIASLLLIYLIHKLGSWQAQNNR